MTTTLRPVMISIDCIAEPATYPDLDTGLSALWDLASRLEIWTPSYASTEEVLTTPDWARRIDEALSRDGRWQAPLVLRGAQAYTMTVSVAEAR